MVILLKRASLQYAHCLKLVFLHSVCPASLSGSVYQSYGPMSKKAVNPTLSTCLPSLIARQFQSKLSVTGQGT